MKAGRWGALRLPLKLNKGVDTLQQLRWYTRLHWLIYKTVRRAVRRARKNAHKQTRVKTWPASLTPAFFFSPSSPSHIYLPSNSLCCAQTHARVLTRAELHISTQHAPPLLHDSSSLLPWQGSWDEIRMTTGMTQSVAVESLRGVKRRVCAGWRVRAANLIFSDSRASLSACICDTFSPPRTRTRRKRPRQSGRTGEGGNGFWQRDAAWAQLSGTQVTKALLAGTTSRCWQRRLS